VQHRQQRLALGSFANRFQIGSFAGCAFKQLWRFWLRRARHLHIALNRFDLRGEVSQRDFPELRFGEGFACVGQLGGEIGFGVGLRSHDFYSVDAGGRAADASRMAPANK
jgi:hypothetical protein